MRKKRSPKQAEQLKTLKELYTTLLKYCDTASEKEYSKLAVVGVALEITLHHLKNDNDFVLSETEYTACLRTVYHVMCDDREFDYLPESEELPSA